MELIATGDGSHTLYLKDLDETYHSRQGAIQESIHVYIKNGLRYYVGDFHKNKLDLFELGLGTGLNTLLSYMEALKFRIRLRYEVIEPFPITQPFWNELNYSRLLPGNNTGNVFLKIHRCSWNKDNSLSDYFILRKEKILFQSYFHVENKFDIIFYDAFAPVKQPEIWHPDLLQKAYQMLIKNGILVTYCSQGNFKRNLKQIGFHVESIPGPPGKKEMVRATK